jgi:hypothetical protein
MVQWPDQQLHPHRALIPGRSRDEGGVEGPCVPRQGDPLRVEESRNVVVADDVVIVGAERGREGAAARKNADEAAVLQPRGQDASAFRSDQ